MVLVWIQTAACSCKLNCSHSIQHDEGSVLKTCREYVVCIRSLDQELRYLSARTFCSMRLRSRSTLWNMATFTCKLHNATLCNAESAETHASCAHRTQTMKPSHAMSVCALVLLLGGKRQPIFMVFKSIWIIFCLVLSRCSSMRCELCSYCTLALYTHKFRPPRAIFAC